MVARVMNDGHLNKDDFTLVRGEWAAKALLSIWGMDPFAKYELFGPLDVMTEDDI